MESREANTVTTAPTPRRDTRSLQSTSILVFQLLLAYRLVNALTLKTFFQPDEYYQTLEPAWQLAFGNEGAAWITWEWRQNLRSALHPTLFAFTYKVASVLANVLGLSSTTRAEVLLVAPKLLQAFLATVTDFSTWKLAQTTYGDESSSAWTALVLTVVSPWQWFCSTRTFSNGLETTLTVMALNKWPWNWAVPVVKNDKSGGNMETSDRAGLRLALFCAAFATILRPTNILIWVTISIFTLQRSFKHQSTGLAGGQTSWSRVYLLLRDGILCGSTVLAISAIADRMFYSCWTFPPYNFLYFNVVQSLATFYGGNNWHYYLSEGYPLLLTTSLPFALLGMVGALGNTRTYAKFDRHTLTIIQGLTSACLVLPGVLSILSHKEVRFIYPLLPLLHVIAAAPISAFTKLAFTTRSISAEHVKQSRIGKRAALTFILFNNLVIIYFTSFWHGSGLITLPNYLRHEFETHYLPTTSVTIPSDGQLIKSQNMTIGILMPCHSLPWRSHLQYPPSQFQAGIQAWALTCEPPLHITDLQEKRTYLDEADIFYDDPKLWLRRNMMRDIPPIHDASTGKLKGNRRKPGVNVADEAMEFKNKQLLKSSDHHSINQYDRAGLDITDLLPYLFTSPANSTSSPHPISNHEHQSPLRAPKRPWPDYLVFFANLEPLIKQVIHRSYGHDLSDVYVQCNRLFNSVVHDDWRRKGDIVVWCRDSGRVVPGSELRSRWQKKFETKFGFELRARDAVAAAMGTKEGGGHRQNLMKEEKSTEMSKRISSARPAVEDRGNRGGKQTVVGYG